MGEQRIGGGARALLFERLVDETPSSSTEVRPFRTHDASGLQASVLRRLELLLNTRATRPRPADRPLTVLDYGLPDYSARYTRDPTVHIAIAEESRRTIAAFEPRLEVDRVEVVPIAGQSRSLRAGIEGRIRSERTTEPVAFSIPLTGELGAQEGS